MWLSIPFEIRFGFWLVEKYPRVAFALLQSANFMQHAKHDRYVNLIVGLCIACGIAWIYTYSPILMSLACAYESRGLTSRFVKAYRRKTMHNHIRREYAKRTSLCS